MKKKIVKRSLALGALMAFVITGSAFAENLEAQGKTEIVTTSTHTNYQGAKLIGGKLYSGTNYDYTGTFVEYTNTNITVNSGNYDEVIGGSYAQRFSNILDNKELKIGDTLVTINGGEVYEVDKDDSNNKKPSRVIGGSKANDVRNISLSTGNTKVVINNGTIYGDVIGGNYIKVQNYTLTTKPGGKEATNTSSLQSSTVIIKNGTVTGNVFAGSVSHTYGDKGSEPEYNFTATDTETNLKIEGGTFSGNIFGAGASIGEGTSASVGQVNMEITGMNIAENATVNVYTGGLVVIDENYNDETKKPTVNATSANVNISNSKLSNIYASNATANNDNGQSIFTPTDEKGESVTTDLTLTNVNANNVEVQNGSVVLSATADGEGTSIVTLTAGQGVGVEMVADGDTTDALNGDAEAFVEKINIGTYQTTNEAGKTETGDKSDITGTMKAGKVVGDVDFTLDENGGVASSNENVNTANLAISDMAAIGLMSWRAETNDMNKRMGELRNANGEHGVWVRMVRGEDEYGSVKNQYNQYQLGYDEKLSVDKHWTVGAALSYTDAESNFAQGSGESTNKALSIYGSKLNDDGTFVDLIAKYARLENDFVVNGGAGDADYSTNGYSFSAEFGKRIQQGKGLWIEPQVELTYGKVSAVDYVTKNGVKVAQDGMESIVGRIGFSLGKDIKQGNVYARASYLYDFDGETKGIFSDGTATRKFEDDLGGGWWEVGVGTNINLSKSTYIYADVEKTFGGEVDTNWQWNLGVRYSF